MKYERPTMWWGGPALLAFVPASLMTGATGDLAIGIATWVFSFGVLAGLVAWSLDSNAARRQAADEQRAAERRWGGDQR